MCMLLSPFANADWDGLWFGLDFGILAILCLGNKGGNALILWFVPRDLSK